MTHTTPSRDLLTFNATFADIYASNEANTSLTPLQRTERRSALNTVARALGRPLENISANPAVLKRELNAIHPAAHNISKRRWDNIRSLISRSVEHFEPGSKSVRSRPIGKEWRGSLDMLGKQRWCCGLSHFARWATYNGILPDDVTQTTAEEFRQYLETAAPVTSPYHAFWHFCRAWNRAREALPDQWPQVKIERGDNRSNPSLPWSMFPASLEREADELVKTATSSLPSRLPRKLKPITALDRKEMVRRFATILVQEGNNPTMFESIAVIVEPTNARCILEVLLQRSEGKITVYIHTMAVILAWLGKHWVGLPEAEIAALKMMCGHLKPKKRGMKESSRAILRDLKDQSKLRNFLELPERNVGRLRRHSVLTPSDLREFQLATAVGILQFAPLRPKNLVGLRIGKEITKRPFGLSARYNIVVDGDNVKNEADLEYWLPEDVGAILDLYIEKIRPQLIESESEYLFPGRKDGHKAASRFSEAVKKLVIREVGIPISVHPFRHTMGGILLNEVPYAHGVVAKLLGDSITTVMKYYSGMERDRALEFYEKTVVDKRNRLSSSQ